MASAAADSDDDLSSSDGESQVFEKQKSSRMLKAKKWFGSKTASSKVGRRAVSHFLGKKGDHLLEALVRAASKHASPKEGQKLKKHLIKIALKAKILNDEGILNEAAIVHLVEPTHYFILQLQESLADFDESATIDVSVLVHLLRRIKKQSILLLRPHINAKNITIVGEVFDFLGAHDFVDALMNNKKLLAEKREMNADVTEMTEGLLEAEGIGGSSEVCRTQGCKRMRLISSAASVAPASPSSSAADAATISPLLRAGSPHCARHHAELYDKLAKNPRMHYFIAEDGRKTCPAFTTIMESAAPDNYLAFFRGSCNYVVSEANKRSVFATMMCEKYFNADATHPLAGLDAKVTEAVVRKVEDQLKAEQRTRERQLSLLNLDDDGDKAAADGDRGAAAAAAPADGGGDDKKKGEAEAPKGRRMSKSQAEGPPLSLFDKVRDAILVELQKAFEAAFLPSPEYKAWLKQFKALASAV